MTLTEHLHVVLYNGMITRSRIGGNQRGQGLKPQNVLSDCDYIVVGSGPSGTSQ